MTPEQALQAHVWFPSVAVMDYTLRKLQDSQIATIGDVPRILITAWFTDLANLADGAVASKRVAKDRSFSQHTLTAIADWMYAQPEREFSKEMGDWLMLVSESSPREPANVRAPTHPTPAPIAHADLMTRAVVLLAQAGRAAELVDQATLTPAARLELQQALVDVQRTAREMQEAVVSLGAPREQREDG